MRLSLAHFSAHPPLAQKGDDLAGHAQAHDGGAELEARNAVRWAQRRRGFTARSAQASDLYVCRSTDKCERSSSVRAALLRIALPCLSPYQIAELRERLAKAEREISLMGLQREGGGPATAGAKELELEGENRRLRQELAEARADGGGGGQRSAGGGKRGGGSAGSGADQAEAMQEQVRKFMGEAAKELEAEVAQMTRRATVAEEQLVETNALLAQNSLRAEREVARLKQLLARFDPAAAGFGPPAGGGYY